MVSSTSSLLTWPVSGTSGRDYTVLAPISAHINEECSHHLTLLPWLLAIFTDIDTYHESWVLGAIKENHVRRLSAP